MGWRVNTDMQALSVYSLRSGQPEELIQGTSYVRYAVNDLNQDGLWELVVFRDSFGSSLAPLLAGSYRKITLIDLRYISSDLLESYVRFQEQDVLFLYSALIWNQSGTIR